MTSNRLLLAGIAFEVTFAAAVVLWPPLQTVFGTALPDPAQLALLPAFPPIVWGVDEVFRWTLRRRDRGAPGGLKPGRPPGAGPIPDSAAADRAADAGTPPPVRIPPPR